MKLMLIVGGTIILLVLFINLFVTLVIFIAEEYHVIDQVKIYQIFQNKRYNAIRQTMLKSNYTIVVGDNNSGLKNFMEHQANLNTLQGKPVLIKKYQSKNKEKLQILKTIKKTRFYLQVVLGIHRKERTQIFFVDEIQEIPFQQIKFIKEKYPNDNIIIVCQKELPFKIKGFKKIIFPQVEQKELKQTMKEYYSIKDKQAKQIIQKYERNIQKIFDHFKEIASQQNTIIDDMIQVQDIENMNEMSEQRANQQKQSIIKQSVKQVKNRKVGKKKQKR